MVGATRWRVPPAGGGYSSSNSHFRTSSAVRVPAMPNAKTIQIFCPTGEPRGVRIAEITTSIVQAVVVPRALLEQALQRPEISRVGIYFLFGQSEESERWQVYIGEADDCGIRIKQHAANPEMQFWQLAVAITSSKQSLTKAHGRLLEHWAIIKAREVRRYEVTNATTPAKPPTPEAMEAESRDVFEITETLLGTLGHPVFDQLMVAARKPESPVPMVPARDNPPVQANRIFFCRQSGADAKGVYSLDGFIVLEGSFARGTITSSMESILPEKRKRLIDSGVLREHENGYKFTRDYAFNSPSAAGAMVTGASVNGWIVWVDEQGRSMNRALGGDPA